MDAATERRTFTDHMRLYGGPLLIASLFMASSADLARTATAMPDWVRLLQGCAVGSVAFAILPLSVCLFRDAVLGKPVEGTWAGRAAVASSRVALVLAFCLATASLLALH